MFLESTRTRVYGKHYSQQANGVEATPCPPTGESVNKMQHGKAMAFSPVLGRKGALTCATTQTDLKHIMLSETSRPQMEKTA